MSEVRAVGKIDNEGKLRVFMGEVNQFLSQQKGAKCVLRIELLPEGNRQMISYYWSYVVPKVRQAMKETGDMMTEKDVDEMLRNLCPMLHTCGQGQKVKQLTDLSRDDLCDYIDWIKQFGAENLSIIID